MSRRSPIDRTLLAQAGGNPRLYWKLVDQRARAALAGRIARGDTVRTAEPTAAETACHAAEQARHDAQDREWVSAEAAIDQVVEQWNREADELHRQDIEKDRIKPTTPTQHDGDEAP